MSDYETVAQSYIDEGIRKGILTENERIVQRLIKVLGLTEAKARELVGEDNSSANK